jgi:hypothetical protein
MELKLSRYIIQDSFLISYLIELPKGWERMPVMLLQTKLCSPSRQRNQKQHLGQRLVRHLQVLGSIKVVTQPQVRTNL